MARIFVSPDFISVSKGRICSDRCARAVSGQITGFRMAELFSKFIKRRFPCAAGKFTGKSLDLSLFPRNRSLNEPLYQWFKVQFLINKNREFCEASREKS